MVWDHNKDGLITDNTELMSEYDKTGNAAFASGYEKLAHYFDKDKNGTIEKDEVYNFFKELAKDDDVREEEKKNQRSLSSHWS